MSATALDRVPVVYIAGMTRSGSTLLGLLLSGRSDLRSVGEVWRVWDNGVVGGGFCSCGSVFGECEFWQAVVRRDPEIFSLDRGKDMSRAAQTVFSARGEAAYWTKPGRRRVLAALPGHYHDTLRRFYEAIRAETGASLIVDFTKNPVFAHLLVSAGVVDMSVIHLVRDPRAVAHSLGRVRRYEWKPGDVRELWRPSPPRAAAVWAVRSWSAEKLLRRDGMRSLLVRYEDLAGDPGGELERIGTFLGRPVPLEPDLARIERHIMGGNPTFRFGGSDAGRVRADDAWKAEMSRRDRTVVTALTLPLLRRYGYRLGGSGQSDAERP